MLLMEAFLFLGIARLLMLYIPFKRLAKMMGTHGYETSCEAQPESISMKRQLKHAVFRARSRAWWKSECLVRALALGWMLRRRKIPYTIYLGVGKDEKDQMIAHAWIRSGHYWMSGEEQREKFTVVSIFSYLGNMKGGVEI